MADPLTVLALFAAILWPVFFLVVAGNELATSTKDDPASVGVYLIIPFAVLSIIGIIYLLTH